MGIYKTSNDTGHEGATLMTKHNEPKWLHWTGWLKRNETDSPDPMGAVVECTVEDGTFTFVTPTHQLQGRPIEGHLTKFELTDGGELTMLPPSDGA